MPRTSGSRWWRLPASAHWSMQPDGRSTGSVGSARGRLAGGASIGGVGRVDSWCDALLCGSPLLNSPLVNPIVAQYADRLLSAGVAGTNTSHGAENNLHKIDLLTEFDASTTFGM